MKLPPSIFNDVIGPVMRGPSSSHCAAAVRIGKMARDLMDGEISSVVVAMDENGSLATTHESQGSDMGLFGGLLGWEATDPRLTRSPDAIREAGIRVELKLENLGAVHPNTWRLVLAGGMQRHTMTAISTGGGMIEVVEIDGFNVALAGDGHETLIFTESDVDNAVLWLKRQVAAASVSVATGSGAGGLIRIKGEAFLSETDEAALADACDIRYVKRLSPVLPVSSPEKVDVPFITCKGMLQFNRRRDLALWELAVEYESARGDMSRDQVVERMEAIVDIMGDAVREGLRGTAHADRILHCQSRTFQKSMEDQRLLDAGLLNTMILYVTAIMETKSAMGVIVAAPTAGACAGLPGACIAAAESMGCAGEETVRAMLAAGMIGVFIAAHATFAAEIGGCQAECGAGSGMAAAALVTLAGGRVDQAVSAAAMALQNVLGMVCDPVANRVEVPCLGKNVLAAGNALACANMALAGYDEVIPLDEVISAMADVGGRLPPELRCTGLGGLSVTPTSLNIARQLKNNALPNC